MASQAESGAAAGTVGGLAPTPSTTPSGTPVPAGQDQKTAVLEEIKAFFDTLPSQGDNTQENEAVRSFLASRSDISSVTVQGGVVAAKFSDGEPFFIFNQQPTQLLDALAGLDLPLPPSTRSAASQIPHKKAVLVNCFPVGDTDLTAVATTLQLTQQLLRFAGYDARYHEGSLETLATVVKDVDVLVVAGHGAVYEDPEGKEKPEFLLSFAETNAPGLQDLLDKKQAYRALIRTTETSRIDPNSKKKTLHTAYALRPSFVQANWTLKAGAMVTLMACQSARKAARDTWGTFFTTQQRAACVIGWDDDVLIPDMLETCSVLFRRMLGVPHPEYPAGPGQRSASIPRDLREAVTEMDGLPRSWFNRFQEGFSAISGLQRATRLTTSVPNQSNRDGDDPDPDVANLVIFDLALPKPYGALPQLRLIPAINDVSMSAQGGQLTINGSFPQLSASAQRSESDPVVFFQGTALEIVSFTEDQIVVNVPGSLGTATNSGDLRVVMDDRRSNAFALGATVYRGAAQVNLHVGQTIHWNLIRALEPGTDEGNGTADPTFSFSMPVRIGVPTGVDAPGIAYTPTVGNGSESLEEAFALWLPQISGSSGFVTPGPQYNNLLGLSDLHPAHAIPTSPTYDSSSGAGSFTCQIDVPFRVLAYFDPHYASGSGNKDISSIVTVRVHFQKTNAGIALTSMTAASAAGVDSGLLIGGSISGVLAAEAPPIAIPPPPPPPPPPLF